MTNDEIIAVVQAAQEGKRIQTRLQNSDQSWQSTDHPMWNFGYYDYRAEPEPREWLLAVDKDDYVVGPIYMNSDECKARKSNGEKIKFVKVREVMG